MKSVFLVEFEKVSKKLQCPIWKISLKIFVGFRLKSVKLQWDMYFFLQNIKQNINKIILDQRANR